MKVSSYNGGSRGNVPVALKYTVSQKVSPEDSYMAELSFWTDEGGEFF